MIDDGDRVVVEGDIILFKALIQSGAYQSRVSRDTIRGARPNDPRFQSVTDTLVSATNIANMVVDLSGISASSAWSAAVRSAMAQWNGIPGTDIYFTEGSPADVTVQFNSTNSGIVAGATPPTGMPGKPGPLLQINSNYGGSLSASQMLYAIAHELGHTIGFRHTNWRSYPCFGQTFNESAANQVAGTPQTDAASIMNACSGGRSWTGFSHQDSIAALFTYRHFSFTESNSAGHPLLTFDYSSRGLVSAQLNLQTEQSTVDDNYDRHIDAISTTPYSTSSPVLDTDNSWGVSDCVQLVMPYLEYRTSWTLKLVYPQQTILWEVPAHTQPDVSSPGIWDCI